MILTGVAGTMALALAACNDTATDDTAALDTAVTATPAEIATATAARPTGRPAPASSRKVARHIASIPTAPAWS
jgi:hypothetical protein